MNLVTDHINSNYIKNSKGLFDYVPIKNNVSFKSGEYRTQYLLDKQNNGLFQRVYDALKNLTGFGVSQRKIEGALDAYEEGRIDEKTIDNYLNTYRNSQKNAEQMFGNIHPHYRCISCGRYYVCLCFVF